MKLLELFLDTFYPHRCIICDELIDEEGYCDDCKDLIKVIDEPTCFSCGVDHKHCTCDRFIYHFDGVTAPYFNEELAQQIVYDFKFLHTFRSVRTFAKEMAERASKTFGIENIDFVTFVPASKKSLVQRGYNQSECYAEYIAEFLNLPLERKLLYKKDGVRTQHKISDIHERFFNVRNGYGCSDRIDGKNVLLVDDIKTSGASLDECARQMKFCGADKVYCVTATITRYKKNKDEES